jgi:hypothetical protein
MSRAFVIVLALVAGFFVGSASAAYAIKNWLHLSGQQSGTWQRLSKIGQLNIDPYMRAFAFISGQLPIGSAEGQTYLASKDSDNRPLNALCNYSVEGEIPAARLFTLHAETLERQTIVASAPLQSALHSDQLLFQSNTYMIHIGSKAQPDNWLALQATGEFLLVLTYYDVAVINDDTGNSTRLPRIVKGRCAND